MHRTMQYFLCLALVCSGAAKAEQIRIAVASNFAPTMAALAERYEQQYGSQLVLIAGSTGKHYAQIRNGAPFDVFFAADGVRPELLEEQGLALPGSRFSYARGRLVLWGRKLDTSSSAQDILRKGQFRFLAIANPELAPYGLAARQVLVRMDSWAGLQKKLVLGENIAQAYQFVYSGNADLGLLALAQLMAAGLPAGSWTEIPSDWHSPIEQQAVLLRESGRPFAEFVQSGVARAIILDHGYELP